MFKIGAGLAQAATKQMQAETPHASTEVETPAPQKQASDAAHGKRERTDSSSAEVTVKKEKTDATKEVDISGGSNKLPLRSELSRQVVLAYPFPESQQLYVIMSAESA